MKKGRSSGTRKPAPKRSGKAWTKSVSRMRRRVHRVADEVRQHVGNSGVDALYTAVGDFLDALDLHDVTVVGNDTGGEHSACTASAVMPPLPTLSFSAEPMSEFAAVAVLAVAAAPLAQVTAPVLAAAPSTSGLAMT